MGIRPVSATERFKVRFANAIEALCVAEEALDVARARIAELEAELAAARGDPPDAD